MSSFDMERSQSIVLRLNFNDMTVAAGVKTVASRSVISDFEDLVPVPRLSLKIRRPRPEIPTTTASHAHAQSTELLPMASARKRKAEALEDTTEKATSSTLSEESRQKRRRQSCDECHAKHKKCEHILVRPKSSIITPVTDEPQRTDTTLSITGTMPSLGQGRNINEHITKELMLPENTWSGTGEDILGGSDDELKDLRTKVQEYTAEVEALREQNAQLHVLVDKLNDITGQALEKMAALLQVGQNHLALIQPEGQAERRSSIVGGDSETGLPITSR